MGWEEKQKNHAVIGVDESGRGCLAGRVYAAAVYLKPEQHQEIYQDSKSLSEAKRQQAAKQIKQNLIYGIAFAEVTEIEALNILKASQLAMKRAVDLVKKQITDAPPILVDGNQYIAYLTKDMQFPIVKGDTKILAISAASILAKVDRDHYMLEMAKEYPQFGFEKHKAYATKIHREAIKTHGPSFIHRKTFAGVKEYL